MIDLEELSKRHYRNRAGNCYADRERWPCHRWRDAETINRLETALSAADALADWTAAQLFEAGGDDPTLFTETRSRLAAYRAKREATNAPAGD